MQTTIGLSLRPTTHMGQRCKLSETRCGTDWCEQFCAEGPTLLTFRELCDYQRFCGTGRTREEEHVMLDVLVNLDEETLRRIMVSKLEEHDYFSIHASRRISSVIALIATIFAERRLVFDTRDYQLRRVVSLYWPGADDVIYQPK